MLSFLSSLLHLFFDGITIGSKKETKNDLSTKNTLIGCGNTSKKSKVNFKKNKITIIVDKLSKVRSFISDLEPPSKDLLDQADSLMRQMTENKEERLLVFRQYGRIVRIRFILSKIDYSITDKVAIPEVLKFLKEHDYLDNTWNNTYNTRHIYDLTLKGREYGKKLLEEDRGNTSI